MKKGLFAIACMFIVSLSATAQVLMAVGYDKDDSAVEYGVFIGDYFDALHKAKNWINNHGNYRNAFRDSERSIIGGLYLEEGIYVVVKASYLLSDGSRRTSYGIGASKDSPDEATKNAVYQLSVYDGLWKKSYGYDVSGSDRFNLKKEKEKLKKEEEEKLKKEQQEKLKKEQAEKDSKTNPNQKEKEKDDFWNGNKPSKNTASQSNDKKADDFWDGNNSTKSTISLNNNKDKDDFWNGDNSTKNNDDFWNGDNNNTGVKTKKYFTDPRDNRKYEIVKIKNQTWIAENMKWKCEGSECENGKIYNIDDMKNVCPSGWHIPTLDDWIEMIEFLSKLKLRYYSNEHEGGDYTSKHCTRNGFEMYSINDIYNFIDSTLNFKLKINYNSWDFDKLHRYLIFQPESKFHSICDNGTFYECMWILKIDYDHSRSNHYIEKGFSLENDASNWGMDGRCRCVKDNQNIK